MYAIFVLQLLSAYYVLPNYAIDYEVAITCFTIGGRTISQLSFFVQLCDYTGKCINNTLNSGSGRNCRLQGIVRGTLSTLDKAGVRDVSGLVNRNGFNQFEVKTPKSYVFQGNRIVNAKVPKYVSLRKCRMRENNTYHLYGQTVNDCKPCNCHNNSKCDQDSGTCVMCAAGFKGNACETQCDNGTFGLDCKGNCSQHCENVCDKRAGNCTCPDGSTSSKCLQRCSRGRYGFNCRYKCDKCINGCNNVNGSCIGGCVTGYVGPKCDPCRNSTYGVNCSHNCNCFKQYACNYTTGDCGRYGCALRWTGNSTCSVNIPCDNHKWGRKCIDCGACLTNCDVELHPCQHRCDRDTGVCGSLCLPNFSASRCDVCDDKMYGRKCNNLCGKCSTSCDTVTGQCFGDYCEWGYLGRKCDIECKIGNFGHSCLMTCSTCRAGRCSFVDGSCIDGCEEGWGGNFCTESAACNDRHWYGPNCEIPCHNCLNDICSYDGTCIHGCTYGYWSVGCRKTCISGMYGRNCERFCGRCAEWGECDKNTGMCARGCMGHFHSGMCTECPSEYFGPECNEKCGHCKHDKRCDFHTGVCHDGCALGFHGHYCEIRDTPPQELDPSL